jgi:phosphoglycolate phosphatase/putative hydrolase of the HAD superfamily
VEKVVGESLKIQPARLKAIVFDVDGTLYAQSGLRRAMLLTLVRAHLVQPWRAYSTFRILGAYRQAQELLRERPIDGDLAAAQVRLACERAGAREEIVRGLVEKWMEQAPLPLLRRFIYPRLPDLLQAAKDRGLRLGVLSDYPATEKLRALGVDHFFDLVLTAQDPAVNRFKPDPAGLREALRRLGADGSQALYVGDRAKVDAAAAQAAGVPCVIVNSKRNNDPAQGWSQVADYAELHAMLFS